jgi:radical SAM protein with 4Fe4S-binding SPASM domain
VESLLAGGVSQISVSLHEPLSDSAEAMTRELCRQFSRRVTTVDLRKSKRDVPIFNRGGAVGLKDIRRIKRCYFTDIMVIRADGNVVLCCQDSKEEYIFGNVKSRGIKDIWERQDFKKIRGEVREGTFHLPICKKCGYEF